MACAKVISEFEVLSAGDVGRRYAYAEGREIVARAPAHRAV